MKLDWKQSEGVTVVHVRGALDRVTIPKISGTLDSLLALGQTRLVLCLKDLEFIDSRGVAYLLDMTRRARERGGDLMLAEPCEFFRKLVRTLGVDRVLRLADHERDAVRSFAAARPC